nr:hypothetical protein [Tanacetum cinerariifolium]
QGYSGAADTRNLVNEAGIMARDELQLHADALKQKVDKLE